MDNLQRFIDAQNPVYDTVLTELSAGKKQTHWMWYIFPQLTGLGTSDLSKYYAIQNLKEGAAYLQHPILRFRLVECLTLVLQYPHPSANEFFGPIDAMKLRSSLTLFAYLSGKKIFNKALEQLFAGKADLNTCLLIYRAIDKS